MTSSIHVQASTVPIFQLTGQGERISTSEKPAPACWQRNALAMAFLALTTAAGLLTATRSRYAVPSSWAKTSQTRMGWPATAGVAPRRRGGRHLVEQRGRRHLAAGHAVHAVVHEDHGDVLAAVGGVDALGGADGGQVAVALVGHDEVLRPHALDAGGHRGAAAVRRLDHVDLEVVVEEHAAAGGSHADGVLLQVHLLDHFHEQAVDDAVAAAGAVVEVRLLEELAAARRRCFIAGPFRRRPVPARSGAR